MAAYLFSLKTHCYFRFVLVAFFLGSPLTSAVKAEESQLVRQLLETRACVRCDLRNVDLSGLDLQGVNLQDADLRGVNLTGASSFADRSIIWQSTGRQREQNPVFQFSDRNIHLQYWQFKYRFLESVNLGKFPDEPFVESILLNQAAQQNGAQQRSRSVKYQVPDRRGLEPTHRGGSNSGGGSR